MIYVDNHMYILHMYDIQFYIRYLVSYRDISPGIWYPVSSISFCRPIYRQYSIFKTLDTTKSESIYEYKSSMNMLSVLNVSKYEYPLRPVDLSFYIHPLFTRTKRKWLPFSSFLLRWGWLN